MKKVLHFTICVMVICISTAFSYGQTCGPLTFNSPGPPATCTYSYTATGWVDSSGNPTSAPGGIASTESVCILVDNATASIGNVKGVLYIASGVTYSGSVASIGSGGILVVEGTANFSNTPSFNSGSKTYIEAGGVMSIPGDYLPGGDSEIHNNGTFNLGGNMVIGGNALFISYPNSTSIIQGNVSTNNYYYNCGLLEIFGNLGSGGGSTLENNCSVYVHTDMNLNANYTSNGLIFIDGNLNMGGNTFYNNSTLVVNNITVTGDLVGNDDTSLLIVRFNATLTGNITGHLYYDDDDGGGFDSVSGGSIEDILIVIDIDIPATTTAILDNCGNDIVVNPTKPVASIDFDGIDDYISVPSFASGLQNATMMAWIKLDASFSAAGEIAGHPMMRMYVDSARKLRSYYITNSSNSAYGSSAPTTLDVEQWYHVAISYEGATGQTKIYVNGKLEAPATIPSGTLSVNPTYTTHDFNIGRRSRFANTYFNGHIDEVRVFDKTLTENQIHQMVYQEIKDNAGNVQGSIIAKDIIDESTNATVPWSNLLAYYPMSDIISYGRTSDFSSYDKKATMNNITTIQDQTAPMPYETVADGDWSTEATWLHGDVWDIEDAANNKDWSIVNIKNDVTTSNSHANLGLFIDANKTLSVTGDNEINNSWFLELNGTLDLSADSQLVQGVNSDLVTSATGKILRRQEGHTNIYWYNYWSSPVGTLAATTLSDNNTAANNANNTPYSLGMLKDGAGSAMQFTTAFDEVGKVSTRWLYAYQNGVTYYDWAALNTSSNITPGLGYTQKGTGNAGIDQQYIFEGKPNNGTILLSATDTGGPGSVESVSKTQYLLGNPYPSAIDAHAFIDDNVGVSSGTLYLWEQWAGSSHWLEAYEGGYATVNKMAKVRAYQFIGIDGAVVGAQNGTKTPTQYLPVGQGFITEIVADGNIEFNNGQRIFMQEGLGESQFFRNGESAARNEETTVTDSTTIKIIRLEFRSSNDLSRELVLGFSNITSDAFDYGYDSTPNQFRDNDLATLLDGKKMVIQAFSEITDDKSVDLVMNSDGNYGHTIRLLETEHIDDSQNIYIHDTQEDIYFDIRNGDYEFTALAGEDPNRFKLVFQTAEQGLSVDDLDQSDLRIFVNQLESKLYVKGIDQEAKSMTLTNMLGQTVRTFNDIENNDLENGLYIGDLSSGVYLVNLITENNLKLYKKIILE